MSENPSTNSVAALREARRRKILENSASRLKLIEGLNSSPAKFSSTFLDTKPEPEVKKTETLNFDNNFSTPSNPSEKINSKLGDILKSNKEFQKISDFLIKDEVDENEEDEEEEGEYEELGTTRGNIYLNKIIQKKLHYILLALAVNLLFFFNAGYLFYDNIFCPFYTLKILGFLSKKEEKQPFPPVLFLLTAALPKSVQNLARTSLSVLLSLLSDLCIYLFTFIIGTKIINNQH